MITQYITNFAKDQFSKLISAFNKLCTTQSPLWKGTVFIGDNPLYIECHTQWISDRIEDFFYRSEKDIKYPNSKELFILNKPTSSFISEPDYYDMYVCFTDNNTSRKPDIIVHHDCLLINNGQQTLLSVNEDMQNASNYFHIGENHLLMRILNYIYDIYSNTTILHCAAVGLNNVGCMISGLSGFGKSTLAAFCTKLGMDFVGDDRIVVQKKDNSLIANPIYSTLSSDAHITWLPIKKIVHNINQNKDVFILDKQKTLTTNLPIKFIIEPTQTKSEKPEINKADPKDIITRICTDYSKLGILARSTNLLEEYKYIYNLLKDLKFFNISLGPDVEANAKAIYQLVNTEAYNV
ncbi:MAG: hypothetical protein MJ156_01470 [Alphaproteobacteria bacterium]|nr:hypothetical protein [Alphaproteobacteria bacterium]